MKAQVLWMGLAASVALTACSSKLESRKTSVKKPAPIVTPDAPAEPSVEQKSAPGEVSPSNQVKFERNLEQGTWSTECGEISFWSRFSQNTARSVLKFEGGRVKLVESNYDWSNCTDLKEEKVLMDSLYYVELDAANPNLATIRTFH
ncbi:MAG TPA: hypothetical protein PKC28_07715, partial [Bdellovibrionales bacterium]|nr:hypothetical protein [Bdellovibrionales bacterium]